MSEAVSKSCSAFSPEGRFLLASLARALAPNGDGSPYPPIADLNWGSVLAIARNHACLPLLYRSLRDATTWPCVSPDPVPASFRQPLRALAMQSAAFAVRATEATRRIQALLREHRIRSAGLKGPALAHLAFGSITARQFGDVDLLVGAADIPRMHACLCAVGYRPLGLPLTIPLATYAATLQDCVYMDPRGALTVDIKPVVISHTLSLPTTTRRFLDASFELPYDDNHTITSLSPEHMLLAVCVHGVHELWHKLSMIADVAGLANRPSLDWPLLLAEAQACHQARALRIGLLLAARLLGLALPEQVRADAERDALAVELAGVVVDRLSASLEPSRPSVQDLWRYERRSRDTLRLRLRCGLRQFLVPSGVDWGLVRLPPGLRSGYYVLRPFRLAWDSLRASRTKIHSVRH